ncbi:MAG: hypothetical protein V3U02_12635 [Calditrichia bacterium]
MDNIPLVISLISFLIACYALNGVIKLDREINRNILKSIEQANKIIGVQQEIEEAFRRKAISTRKTPPTKESKK